MKIIDGTGIPAGRLASYVAKELLKGEEINVVNCEKVIITGNKKNIEKEFHEKRGRVGSVQKGPRHHKTGEKIVKRIIRGMLPNYREGRGRDAWKRLRCYNTIPKELNEQKIVSLKKEKKRKFEEIKEFSK